MTDEAAGNGSKLDTRLDIYGNAIEGPSATVPNPRTVPSPNVPAIARDAVARAILGEDMNSIVGAWEKRGQQDLVNSDTLPVDGSYTDRWNKDNLVEDPRWAEMGFALGDAIAEPNGQKPMFRYATLPEGWTRKASEHDMWSSILDERGRERVAIFYKASFYDRSAHMNIIKLEGPVNGLLYDDHPFELEDTYHVDAASAPPERQSCKVCYGRPKFRWHHPEFPFGDEVE